MKTKTVDYYVQLWEGWQKSIYPPILCENIPENTCLPQAKIFRVRLTLPIIEDPNIPTVQAEVTMVEEAS